MMDTATVPTAALVVWGITLLIIAVVIVPLAVALLQRTLKAARSIESYLAEMRAAGLGVAQHTGAIPALDQTIGTAGAMGGVAGRLAKRAAAIAGILAARAGRTDRP